MNRKSVAIALMWVSLGALPLVAQPHGTSKPGEARSEIRLQFLSFDNFFNVSAPASTQTVNALQAEYRGARRLQGEPLELYWHLNYLQYSKSTLEDSYGGRLGVSHEGPQNDYKAYVDLAKNRPASEVRNGGTADRGTIYGEYGYRPSSQWRLVVEGTHENQRFAKSSPRDNTFNGIEAVAHYTGLGYRVTPGLGVGMGRRSVNDSSQSYGSRDVVASAEFVPVDLLYLSIGYHLQKRSYSSAPGNPSEDHGNWEVVSDWHAAPRVHLTLYYSSEDVNASVAQSDYRTGILILGAGYRF